MELLSITTSARPSVAFALQCQNVSVFHLRSLRRRAVSNISLTDVNDSTAEEQSADLVCQIVIAHDVDLPLIERSNGVESAVDEIKQVGR